MSGMAIRLIRTIAALAGPGCVLIEASERSWASATFSGARHSLAFDLVMHGDDAPLPAALSQLPDHEFDVGREIVADCALTIGPRRRNGDGTTVVRFHVELLTICAD